MTGVWFGDLSLSIHLFPYSETYTNSFCKTTNDTNKYIESPRMTPIARIDIMKDYKWK